VRPKLSDWVHFFAGVGADQWSLAGTITLLEAAPTTERRRHPDVAVSTAKYLLYRLNRSVYKQRAKKHRATVASLMILGKNALGDVTHLHFALGLPECMDYTEFEAVVAATIRSLYWCAREFDLKPYRDCGWLRYVLAHGSENLILDCCTNARS
jgi:hypothetical protein